MLSRQRTKSEQQQRAQAEEQRFYFDEGLKVVLVLFMVLGITARIEQAGIIAGFAALLTGLADQPGSLRERTFGLSVFAILGFMPMVLASMIGSNPPVLLVLLFVVTAAFTWMSGYGTRLAHIGWVLTIWTTLVLGFRVWENTPVIYVGYACGSLLVVFVSVVPVILRGTDLASPTDTSPLIPARDRPLSQLALVTLIKATAVALASFVGQQYIQFNMFWVALTTVLMMPPEIKIHWNRSLQRAVGTVLGAIAGYVLVRFQGANEWVLQAVEVVMAFMLIATIKRKPYGLFVFFLTVFVVAQLGLRGIDVAREGGIQRVQATLAGIAIAITTSLILVPIIRNPASIADPAKSHL